MAIDEASPDLNGIDTTDDKDLWKIARWVAEIDLYNRETKVWDDQAKRIVRRYKDERKSPEEENRRRFNVLWSNIQTTLPALYAKNPKPDIQRRFKDDDPVGRVASSVFERSVSYFVDTDFFAGAVRGSVLDYLLSGRGTSWVRYEPKFEKDEIQETDDVEVSSETPEGGKIAYEKCVTDYVNREDFGHNICRTYDELWCGWRKVYMDKGALVRRFKDKAVGVPLDHVSKDNTGKILDDGIPKAVIYELWDKERDCAVWFHKDIPEALDLKNPPPLKLEDFFPFPPPMLTNLANDSLIPVPDYREYQDQADELDSLTGRIASIQKSLKVAGVYDASAPALKRLLGEGVENELIPVESWAVFAEKGGLKSAIDLLPLKDIVSALTELYSVRAQVKNDLYEITGMSDIVRGVSDPNETAAAQEIKSNFATMRIGDRQREVQRFVRGLIRIMVDVISNHFQDETIKTISGIRLFTQMEKQQIKAAIAQYQQMAQRAQAQHRPPPPPPQPPGGLTQDQVETMMNDPSWEEVFALIRNNALRCFRIDIELNSTIKQDEDAEKASRVEYTKAVGEYLQNALPAGQQHPELVPFLIQGLVFLARAFPVGKDMESALHVAMAKLEKAAQNPTPRPDPEMMKVQGDQQIAQAKLQADQQANQQELQGKMQLEQMSVAAEERKAQQKMEIEASVDQHRNELEAQREALRMANEMRLQELKLQSSERVEIEVAHIKAAASIEVARITQAADDGAAAEAREVAAEGDDMDTQKVIEASTKTHQDSQDKADKRHQQMMDVIGGMAKQHQASMEALAKAHSQAQQQGGDTTAQILKALTAEKELVRDPKTGKAIGVRHKATGAEKAAQLQ